MSIPDHVPVLFDKARAEQLLKAIEKGEPIAPPDPAGWTVHDRLMVAGVLAFTVGTCPNPAGKSYSGADLMAAVALCSQLAELVLDDTYDVDFEEQVHAAVRWEQDRAAVQFLSGAKGGTT